MEDVEQQIKKALVGRPGELEDIFVEGADKELLEKNPSVYDRLYMTAGMLYSACGLSSWCFDRRGALRGGNFPSYRLFLNFFRLGGGLRYALGRMKTDREPMILTDPLDMLWLAEPVTDEYNEAHLLSVYGPIYNTRASLQGLEAALSRLKVSKELRNLFLEKLDIVPVLSQTNILQYLKMIHYMVTGNALNAGAIHYQTSESGLSGSLGTTVNNAEQARNLENVLLQMVREGNIHGLGTVDKRAAFVSVDDMGLGDPKRSACNAIIAFTALCARAAIDGGLSPVIASELEAYYNRCIEKTTLLTELFNLKQVILEDFTTRVYHLRQAPGISQAIQERCLYIHSHLRESLELRDIAQALGYAEYYLSKKFLKETGVRLTDYIRDARIERAKLMLLSGQTVEAVSAELQFHARGYFSRVFKETVGMTPAEFRQKNGRRN